MLHPSTTTLVLGNRGGYSVGRLNTVLHARIGPNPPALFRYGDLKKVLKTCVTKGVVLSVAEMLTMMCQITDGLGCVRGEGGEERREKERGKREARSARDLGLTGDGIN